MKTTLVAAATLIQVFMFSQKPYTLIETRPHDLGHRLGAKLRNPEMPAVSSRKDPEPPGPNGESALRSMSSQGPNPPGSWKEITGSMNIFGVVESNSKPLQFNDELNAVSFVHRKSASYVPNPFPSSTGAETGAIVGVFSDDWGTTWDTTLLWNNETYWARYPQGGIYNPPMNKMLCMSYLVATGPVTGATDSWQGSFMASKQLDKMGGTGNNDTMSQLFGASDFIANTSPFPFGKFDYPSLDFSVTDDGAVRTLGYLVNNVNGTTNAAFGWQGASVVQATFISGAFNWMADSIIPDIYFGPQGSQYVSGIPHMAWNESGTVGYVWFIGVRNPRPGQGDTLSNMGYQPIVFKWTSANPQWTEQPRINFNSPAFQPVLDQIFSVQGDSLGIPFFNTLESVDGIVDRNDRLHIVSTVVGTFSKNPDSLAYSYLLTHNDGETYRFGHRPGLRPFIFDFTSTSLGWQVNLIDSMSSEAAGTDPNDPGVGDNPWDATGGTGGTDKADCNSRIQLSRTPDGKFIIYTWAESDTGFTIQGHKWNQLPNVKARMAEIDAEVGSAPAAMHLHATEINITSPAPGEPPYTTNPKVSSRAVMHYVSPKTVTLATGAFGLPVTVSNNSFVPMKQRDAVIHHYLSANLNFSNVSQVQWPSAISCITTAIVPADPAALNIFPNPVSTTLHIKLKHTGANRVSAFMFNAVGQQVRAFVSDNSHENVELTFDVKDLPEGVYFVEVNDGVSHPVGKVIVRQ